MSKNGPRQKKSFKKHVVCATSCPSVPVINSTIDSNLDNINIIFKDEHLFNRLG